MYINACAHETVRVRVFNARRATVRVFMYITKQLLSLYTFDGMLDVLLCSSIRGAQLERAFMKVYADFPCVHRRWWWCGVRQH